MNSRELKFYDILLNNPAKEFKANAASAPKLLNELLDFEYDECLNGIFYLINKHETLFDNQSAEREITSVLFEKMIKVNRTRTVKAITTAAAVTKCFYTLSSAPYCGSALEILVGFIVSAKLEDADTLLKALFKNEKSHFGAGMVKVLDAYFAALKSKQTAAKPDIPKKVATFLFGWFEKIKTPEKALLAQRLKEVL